MSADPDFYPLASAWLEGSATPPEQRLLGEILHTPGTMGEYASLCRTEALLALINLPAAARRAALSNLLNKSSRPLRLTPLWQSRTVRWGAAAAVLALAAWALWPARDPGSPEPAGKKNRIPQMATAPTVFPNSTDKTPLPPASPGLEDKLSRYYVTGFRASGPLPEAAAELVKALHLPDTAPLEVDVRTTGDAPVELHPGCALPAWTVLRMMALQTGTECRISANRLVFSPARKPVPVTGSLTKTTGEAPLRLLLGMPKATNPAPLPEDIGSTDKEKEEDAKDEDSQDPADSFPVQPRENPADLPQILSAFTREAFGVSLAFTVPDKSGVKYTGSPRAVRVLELALSAPARPAMEVECQFFIVAAPKDLFENAVREVTGDPNVEIFRLTLNEVQRQMVMRGISMTAGVDLMTMPLARGPANEPMESSVKGKVHENTGVFSKFSGLVNSQNELTLSYSITVREWIEQEKNVLSSEDVGTVSTPSGMTIVVPGSEASDGKQLTYLITGTVHKNEGILPVEAPKPPVQEELPYGIPVPGKAGMVFSPYAPDKGQIDVEGFKRGTRVECPYSGKHFRVP